MHFFERRKYAIIKHMNLKSSFSEASKNFTKIRNTLPGFAAHPSMASDAFSGDTMLEINFSTGQFPVFI